MTTHPKYNATILAVEDVEMMQEIERGLLSLFGCKVDFASNGEQAIEFFQSKKYDLVLLDLQLPGMHGFEVAKKLRDIKKDHPPIIVITASTLSTEEQKQQSNTINDWLFKPIELKSLAKILQKHLKENEK